MAEVNLHNIQKLHGHSDLEKITSYAGLGLGHVIDHTVTATARLNGVLTLPA